jgi:L-aminopeptidase/D-esterase-like protein
MVPAAALFDLSLGRSDVRPDAAAGYAACQAAGETVAEGCVGAGTGATVAKLGGPGGAIKSGIGTACRRLPDGTLVGALVAVNAVGGVYDPRTGEPIATPRTASATVQPLAGVNTTIGVIATTARLDAGGLNRLAITGHDGLALAIRPAHTLFDGDALFALSLPPTDAPEATPADVLALGQAAAEVVVEAILRGVRAATSLHGMPAATSPRDSTSAP